jgi:hypothetical protein
VRAARQLALVAARKGPRRTRIPTGLLQVAGEALVLQPRGVELAAAVQVPELVVDASIGLEAAGRERETPGPERDPEGGPLRPPEVEEGVVEVEEDGSEGQGYFAR